MNKISVAIATFNEGKNIGRCLKSVASWVDEIVLVDGSSADKTVEIAKKYKAKVIICDNPPIFHINKQKAIDNCKGEWILQLDADEIVTEELKDEILSIINPQPTAYNRQPINGYWIPRKNLFLGRFLNKGGQYPDYTLRLYKRGKGRLPCKSVHEQAEVDGVAGYLKNPLFHYAYSDFSHYLTHFNLYTDILAEELVSQRISFNCLSICSNMFIKPVYWFLLTYIRHKGFQDGFAGFVFSLFSALRFPTAYIKYWEKVNKRNNEIPL
ncbi:MAG: lipopolysaccharide biosynthesis glycosyltransferase [uncultured bacterium]|nr:MAG: lipopolysaccharide biosynthesis glycosyltransferase [uncultured bacterium]